MQFERKSNRLWISECGLYRVACTGIVTGLTYSATFKRPDGSYQELGLFMRGNGQENADNAKQACYDHAAGQGSD